MRKQSVNIGTLKIKNFSSAHRSKSERGSPTVFKVNTRSVSPIEKHSCSPLDISHVPKLQGPSFNFGTLPRFSENLIIHIKRHPTPSQFKQINQRIQQNIEQSKILPSEKMYLVKKIAKKKKIRGEIARLARENIIKSKKNSIENGMKFKQMRFEFKSRSAEIQKIIAAWITGCAVFGVAFDIFTLIGNRRKLRNRSIFSLLWLRGVCKCIGKFILLKNSIRKKAKLKLLGFRLMPRIKLWLSKRKKQYMNQLVAFIQKLASSAGLLKVVFVWNQQLRFLQQSLKKCLLYKKISYQKLILKWNSVEEQYFMIRKNTKFLNKKDSNQRFMKSKKNNRGLMIPNEIKLYCIRKELKRKLRWYLNAFCQYKLVCKEVDEFNNDNKFEIAVATVAKKNYPEKPKYVSSIVSMTDEDFCGLIKIARKIRVDWEAIINNEKSPPK